VSFKGKLIKLGGSCVVTIPSQYLKDNNLTAGQEIQITLNTEATQ
jgi:antitoxin component of MazEF toxin-antitoxin module